jgi:hypothetical protein
MLREKQIFHLLGTYLYFPHMKLFEVALHQTAGGNCPLSKHGSIGTAKPSQYRRVQFEANNSDGG